MIRRAVPDDVGSVVALIRAAYEGYIPALGREPQPMGDDYTDLIAAGRVSVLEDSGKVIGVLVVQPEEYDAMLIRTVGIAPECQNRGLGTLLMAHAEAIADAEDRTRVRLYTNEVMNGTARLYARLGYQETHRTGPEGRQVIYMAKEVPRDRTPWYDIIVTDTDVCFGKPRIVGTRHYIDHLLKLIEGGGSFDTIIDDYPDLDRAYLEAMMGFVRDAVAAKRNALKSEHRNA